MSIFNPMTILSDLVAIWSQTKSKLQQPGAGVTNAKKLLPKSF